jgi:hypothetical protein
LWQHPATFGTSHAGLGPSRTPEKKEIHAIEIFNFDQYYWSNLTFPPFSPVTRTKSKLHRPLRIDLSYWPFQNIIPERPPGGQSY